MIFLATLLSASSMAQNNSLPEQNRIAIDGIVKNSAGNALASVTVTLLRAGSSVTLETKTKSDGTFLFSGLAAGVYSISVEAPEWKRGTAESVSVSQGERKHVQLVLESKQAGGGHSSAPPMEFVDTPNFTVAGVTDWSNVGLHGSGADVRTSDALAKETLTLKSGATGETSGSRTNLSEEQLRAALDRAPRSFQANHQLGEFYCHAQKYAEALPLLEAAEQLEPGNLGNSYELGLAYAGMRNRDRAREQIRQMLAQQDNAESHRRAGEIYEQLGDPMDAVREYEQATRMNGSEENYFDWGSEFLVHRAAQPAVEVFTKGSSAHPDSARMLTGLGAALYGAGSYDEAAKKLCKAADLKPEDPAPYIFLGKIEKASAETLPCSEEKLAKFAKEQPGNGIANYYYGLILWKHAKGSESAAELQRAQEHLEKAVKLDPKLDEAHLQLGIVHAERGDFTRAASSYGKAIEINPQLGEAHYRLGLVYKRMGEESKAQGEFQIYKQIEKVDAETIEKQRREQLQFLVIPKDKPADTPPR